MTNNNENNSRFLFAIFVLNLRNLIIKYNTFNSKDFLDIINRYYFDPNEITNQKFDNAYWNTIIAHIFPQLAKWAKSVDEEKTWKILYKMIEDKCQIEITWVQQNIDLASSRDQFGQ